VKEDTSLQNALENSVLIMVDVATPQGKDLAETFHVMAFPTFAVLNADGEALYSWIGYGQPGGWIERLSEALQDPITVTARQDRYRSQPSFQDALLLGKFSYREGRFREAESYYRQAQILDSVAAARADVPILIFRTMFRGTGAGQFTPEQVGSQIEEMFTAGEVTAEGALEIAENLTYMKDQIGHEVITPYLKMAYPIIRDIDDPELQGRRKSVLAEYALVVEKDPEKATELKRASFPQGWESDPGALNEFAWWCFQNRINSAEAETLSRRSIELSQPGAEQANYLDTLAELVNLRGDTADAVELIKKALTMNPDSRYLKDQLSKFRDILTEKNPQESSS
jgi:tetratricopeptide (TPR) repeat protein